MDKYYRNLLSTEQAKKFYDMLSARIDGGDVSGEYVFTANDCKTALDDGLEAMSALCRDRPDYFFFENKVQASLTGKELIISSRVLYDRAQIARIRTQLERVLTELTAGTENMTVFRREKEIYKRLVLRMTYVASGEIHDHNIVAPTLCKKGVCDGYCALLILAFRRVGIPCIKVSGIAGGENHAWIVVWLNGKTYHADPTWEHKAGQRVFYCYLNLADSEISKTHTSIGPVPFCNSYDREARSGTQILKFNI